MEDEKEVKIDDLTPESDAKGGARGKRNLEGDQNLDKGGTSLDRGDQSLDRKAGGGPAEY
jgi:hypothetical protein